MRDALISMAVHASSVTDVAYTVSSVVWALTCDTNASIKRTFLTESMSCAFTKMSESAVSSRAIDRLACAVCGLVEGDDDDDAALSQRFVTGEMKVAFAALLLATETSPDSAQKLKSVL